MSKCSVAWSLILSLLLLWFHPPINVVAEDGGSLVELRGNGVVTQSYWWSCGAAAVATILTHYHDIPATEAEVLELIIQNSTPTPAMAAEGALTLLDLKQALQVKGLETKAYRLDTAILYDYFARGGLPVIMHLTYPRAHFVVGVGIIADGIAVADPSFGERILEWSTIVLEKGFTGYVLVPIPTAQKVSLVYAQQELALARFYHRSLRLQALGGDLHHW